MRVRRLWPAALLLLTPVLAACGDDDPDADDTSTAESTPTEATPTPTPTPPPSSTPTAPSSAAGTLPAACDVVSAADLDEAYGMPFGAPEVGGGSTTEQDVEWSSDDCSFEADDLAEVTVKLTGPEDFVKGSFGCPQPLDVTGVVEPAQDIAGATGGWWKVSSPPEFEGELRACTDAVLLQIDLDYEEGVQYEGDPLNQSVGLAEKILAAIKG
ncbi:hypothetical protein KVF89_23265 [Nocardioides carbamazepini]|uniref:hypothetical protein n=1 Tax=Nocardioides carbamazepini TaxID=2854259 RepID=UPI002149CF95|nr:hypothetical protein [Nocardioides carbamazepini]MCR1785477.1 hypothetical protein [Nocardioides carbamazepini]